MYSLCHTGQYAGGATTLTIRTGNRIHNLKQAKGSVEILQDAPEYLKTMGIMKSLAFPVWIGDDVIGGEIIT